MTFDEAQVLAAFSHGPTVRRAQYRCREPWVDLDAQTIDFLLERPSWRSFVASAHLSEAQFDRLVETTIWGGGNYEVRDQMLSKERLARTLDVIPSGYLMVASWGWLRHVKDVDQELWTKLALKAGLAESCVTGTLRSTVNPTNYPDPVWVRAILPEVTLSPTIVLRSLHVTSTTDRDYLRFLLLEVPGVAALAYQGCFGGLWPDLYDLIASRSAHLDIVLSLLASASPEVSLEELIATAAELGI
jgi:hypothetical protein